MPRQAVWAAVAVAFAVVLAGCGSAVQPEAAGPARPVMLRVEAEAFAASDTACVEGTDALVGIVYEAWASEGLLLRLPRPGCGVEFDVDMPVGMRLAEARVLSEASSAKAVLRVTAEGDRLGTLAWSASAGEAVLVPAQDAATVPPGPLRLRVEYEAGPGPLSLDYLAFLPLEPAPTPTGSSPQPGANATTATAPPGGSVGLAGPMRVEAEAYSYGDGACGDSVQVLREAWASEGLAVRLPHPGCPVVFEDLDLPAQGNFTAFAARLDAGGQPVEMRLRVLVEREVVASALFDQRLGDAPFNGPFDTPRRVPAGSHDVTLEFQVVSGAQDVGLVVDYVEFRSGGP